MTWRITLRAGALAASAAIAIAATGATAATSQIAAYSAQSGAFVALSGSVPDTSASRLVGHHASGQMIVSLVLRPSGGAAMDRFLSSVYDPTSPLYHRWLARGEFVRRFAPAASDVAAARRFLSGAGLRPTTSPTAFIVRGIGSTARVEAAFNTRIDDYRSVNGTAFYVNDSAVHVPAALASSVLAVGGLTNTVRLHPRYVTTRDSALAAGKAVPSYGGGPGGSGLTPSQVSSLYHAGPAYQLGDSGKGKGATLAVFELSGFTGKDIPLYEHQFFGPSENVPVTPVRVDGGPLSPVCPAGDSCGPFGPAPCANGCNSADYSGDIEVEADIETQIALAPKIDQVYVYNAPNDETGVTSVDEYFKIANDDLADSISTSWGLCEKDEGLAGAEAEYVAFAQMAAQGQSMFDAAGDEGAYDCLLSSGTRALAIDDPTSQPFVTSVGGTSFGTFDPGTNPHPAYPGHPETVWNPLNKCSGTTEGIQGCIDFGASGGGVSRFWPRPAYQHGPGVNSSLSRHAPFCSQASSGQFCREAPDVSANADQYTPYTEYCTGARTTTGAGASTCGSFSSSQPAPGWFGIGGTSLSSPVWSAIIALSDSIHGARFGTANRGLYTLFRSADAYRHDFHDITGINQTETGNGFYPTTVNYDMATGIGSPNIGAIARANP